MEHYGDDPLVCLESLQLYQGSYAGLLPESCYANHLLRQHITQGKAKLKDSFMYSHAHTHIMNTTQMHHYPWPNTDRYLYVLPVPSLLNAPRNIKGKKALVPVSVTSF